jgi:hypothetical protein
MAVLLIDPVVFGCITTVPVPDGEIVTAALAGESVTAPVAVRRPLIVGVAMAGVLNELS